MLTLKLKITNDHLQELEHRGNGIYHSNEFLRDIAEFMEHPESYAFFTKYMTLRSKLEEAILFMNIYDEISKVTKNYDLNGLQKLALTVDVARDKNLRQIACEYVKDWFNKNSI